MRRFLLNVIRLYFRYFPVRKGKIPLMLLVDKTGLTKHFEIQSSFDNGIKINLNLDDWIQKQIFFFGRYEIEKHETLFWQNIVKSGQYVFDIGANIGYYSLQAAARVGTTGRVFCFEPVSITYRKLRANVELNNFTNISTEQKGVSDMESEIELFVADENSTGSSSIAMHVNFSGIKEKVKTISIDKYIQEHNIIKADLVKIDVEGCEPLVIKGMVGTMNKHKPLVLIEVLDERLNTIGSSKEELYGIFNRNNYESFEIKNYHSVKRLNQPTEGGLIVFKHRESSFPAHISIQD